MVEVLQSTLDDLRERPVHTRWPDAVLEEGWERGTNLAYLRSLTEHWVSHFDWRQQRLVEDIRAFFRSRRSTSGAADAAAAAVRR